MFDSKRVSIKDIANELNVSLATVHKALNGKPGVGDKRRKQITETARAMGYVANGAAQSLARKDINLGVLMPDKWQEFFADMKSGITEQINRLREYNKVNARFMYLSPDTSSQTILDWLMENKIDAVLYCPSDRFINEITSAALRRISLPVFCVGGELDSFSGTTDIIVDAELSGKLAADFLKCTARPNIKVAVFIGSLKVSPHRIKAEAFCKRIQAAGGQVVEICETEDDSSKALSEVQILLDKHPDITGIYVGTSTSAPICNFIQENCISGISLICTDIFDSLKGFMKSGIADATICQNQEKVGQMAVNCAYEYLNKSNPFNSASRAEKKILIRPSLLLCADIE